MSSSTGPDRLQRILAACRKRGVMDPARLEDLVAELLLESPVEDPDAIGTFVRDFLHALLSSSLAADYESPACQTIIAERLATRLDLAPEMAHQLVRLVLAPQFRVSHSADELAAFEARFGTEAAHVLEAESERLDLGGFANRYDSEDALFLLDTLLHVADSSSGIEQHELAALQAAADELGVDDRYYSTLLWSYDPRHESGEMVFPLEADEIRIGRSPNCEVKLIDPQVAPLHAHLKRRDGTWRVVDAGSGRPTVLDGNAIRSAPLAPGQRLGIGPYTMWLDPDNVRLRGRSTDEFFSLTVEDVSRTIHRGEEQIPLLSDISFTVYSGEVVALVGPSGSGKTTLLNAISGIAPADTGRVRFDRADFHRLLAFDRSIVGMVPQDDLVHAELTVEESLGFAARLRFPHDVTSDDIDEAVDRVVRKLDIAHIRRNRIGNVERRGISGGQRKRVNLGQELLTRGTRILFLDEPTSGLDPRAAQDIVRLVRRLADEGRIVFLVTHDLTPAIMNQVDHLLVLAPGGHLAFFGPRAEACRFFGVSTPDAIFNRLDDEAPADWGARYHADPAWRKYIRTRHFLTQRGAIKTTGGDAADSSTSQRHSLVRDLWTQTRRYMITKARDHFGSLVLVAQPLLLAAFMYVAFPRPSPPAVFMLTLASLWFGMSSSVRELIADRAIWRRERRVGARLLPYLGSKVGVMGAVVILQCCALAGILYVPLQFDQQGTDLLLLLAVQSLTGLVGMAIGLLVSASFSSSEAAVGMLPLVLVPAITFSSIMVPIREMTDFARALTWVNPFRYAFEAALKCSEQLQSPAPFRVERWEAVSTHGHLFNLGFLESPSVKDMGVPMPWLLVALGSFVGGLLLVTAVITWRRDLRA